MNAEQEQILTKIKKLLALATSDNEAEASAAAAKAQTMLFEHNISEEELESFDSHKSEKVIEVRTTGKTGRNVTVWYSTLALVVAQANLCKLLQSGTGLIWIGKKTNIEVAQYIFDNLVRDLIRICDNEFYKYKLINDMADVPAWRRVHGKTWKNNFYFGAIQSLKERLTANLTQLKEVQVGVSALIVRNDIELDEYMKIKYPRLSHTSYGYTRARSAFETGKAAGRSLQFRNGISSGGNLGPRLLNKGK